MADLTLYIGNKNYSSWSLRSWLMIKQTGAPFEEVVIPLEGPGRRTTAIRPLSPSGRVPALKHGELVLWESTAIGEYLAELFPNASLWPEDRAARAIARAVSAEMHCGFAALRTAMPMNIRRTRITLPTTPAVDEDVARITTIWRDCRTRFGAAGSFLFGTFGIADAMFAPVATRFRTYGVTLDAVSAAYVDAIYTHPAMREWIDAAHQEAFAIPDYDAIGN